MINVLGCLALDHDLRLVALAAAICVMACFTTFELLARGRAQSGAAKLGWTALSGLVAGSGIWATHFVAMLAHHSTIAIEYDFFITLSSWVIAVVIMSAALYMAQRRLPAWLCGLTATAAIGVMHYTGMLGVRGALHLTWDYDYVVASFAACLPLTIMAFHLASQGENLRRTLLATCMLVAAIVALHFTGMTGVTLMPDATRGAAQGAMDDLALSVTVAAIASLVIGLSFVSTIVDRLRKHVASLEAMQRQLKAASAELERALMAEARGNEEKARFIATMSHELRTPLNAIIGFSEVLQAEPFAPLGHERYTEYVHDIHTSGLHLLALINDVLELARLDAGQTKLDVSDCNLSELIQEAVRLITPQAQGEGHKLFCSAGDPALIVRIDRRRTKQVLLNLLSNAIKFTPPGGLIELTVTPGAHGVSMRVRDTGIGMKAEDIPVALSRFGQIDSGLARTRNGTGLGMPISKQLIELHGGTFTVESVLGAGTTVTITLPAACVVSRGMTCALAG